MHLTDMMTYEERVALKQKRIEFLLKTVDGYSSLEDYARDGDEWFAILSVELSAGEKGISLWFQLGYYDHEEYFIEISADGQLVVSPVIAWQDFCCSNGYLNIFTEENVDSDEFHSTD